MGKEQPFQQMVWKNWISTGYAKEWKLNFTHTNVNSKWIRDLNVRARTIKPLEENIGVNLHDLGLGNGFLNMTPKAQAVKENKLEITKIQNFCASEDIFKKVKRQPTD